MRARVSQRPYIHNGREAVLYERMKQGDCTFCPPNANENENGHHSNWGKKRAAKREYATGKKRNLNYRKKVRIWHYHK